MHIYKQNNLHIINTKSIETNLNKILTIKIKIKKQTKLIELQIILR